MSTDDKSPIFLTDSESEAKKNIISPEIYNISSVSKNQVGNVLSKNLHSDFRAGKKMWRGGLKST